MQSIKQSRKTKLKTEQYSKIKNRDDIKIFNNKQAAEKNKENVDRILK